MFIKRTLAYLFDTIMLAAAIVLPHWIFYVVTGRSIYADADVQLSIYVWVILTVSLPVWLYFILCERFAQQTLGKRIVRITVTNRQGRNINFGQAVVRTLIKLLPWELTHWLLLVVQVHMNTDASSMLLLNVPNVLIVVYAAILIWTKGEKGLHDIIVQTRVNHKL